MFILGLVLQIDLETFLNLILSQVPPIFVQSHEKNCFASPVPTNPSLDHFQYRNWEDLHSGSPDPCLPCAIHTSGLCEGWLGLACEAELSNELSCAHLVCKKVVRANPTNLTIPLAMAMYYIFKHGSTNISKMPTKQQKLGACSYNHASPCCK